MQCSFGHHHLIGFGDAQAGCGIGCGRVRWANRGGVLIRSYHSARQKKDQRRKKDRASRVQGGWAYNLVHVNLVRNINLIFLSTSTDKTTPVICHLSCQVHPLEIQIIRDQEEGPFTLFGGVLLIFGLWTRRHADGH
jgi:hypothetical protein